MGSQTSTTSTRRVEDSSPSGCATPAHTLTVCSPTAGPDAACCSAVSTARPLCRPLRPYGSCPWDSAESRLRCPASPTSSAGWSWEAASMPTSPPPSWAPAYHTNLRIGNCKVRLDPCCGCCCMQVPHQCQFSCACCHKATQPQPHPVTILAVTAELAERARAATHPCYVCQQTDGSAASCRDVHTGCTRAVCSRPAGLSP
mmetsp:Transcript_38512/g.108846  ORF Transcript_38512/g.108846 Transcript_38512/m.108846 type:complete len:201 (+) Transcript_38512:2099-2701(+)